MPPRLPQCDDHSPGNEFALASLASQTASQFDDHLDSDQRSNWKTMKKMLENLTTAVQYGSLDVALVEESLSRMAAEDVLVFLIHSQNAGIIIRKFVEQYEFESFEVSPASASVMDIVEDPTFRQELARFLSKMDQEDLDSAAITRKAGSDVIEERDTAHPRYITELLTGILRGIGREANVLRIQKRVRDDVLWNDARLPWRRSPLWLIIRVALQTSLCRKEKNDLYKTLSSS
ncbi:hypothetical protein A0H81_02021 [Grifola frondosa]|uniref:DUF6606 domain-containing protein n=1 Tax=Grifola frondosa TaxID=5627 RepID=A0A1C7MU31_GRIFR|nr:hypothetical protein A0H81_02021 [Grifola frondosa]